MVFRYPLTCFNFYFLCFLRRDPGSVGISKEILIWYTHIVSFLQSFLPSSPSASFSAFFLPAFLPSCFPPSNIMFPVYYAPGTGDTLLRSISATKEPLVQWLYLQIELDGAPVPTSYVPNRKHLTLPSWPAELDLHCPLSIPLCIFPYGMFSLLC